MDIDKLRESYQAVRDLNTVWVAYLNLHNMPTQLVGVSKLEEVAKLMKEIEDEAQNQVMRNLERMFFEEREV